MDCKLTLGILITRQCNFSCGHCMLSCTGNQSLISHPVLMRFFEIVGRLRPNTVSILGGEPSLFIDTVEEIVKHVKPYCREIRMLSNGSFLLNTEKEKRIRNMDIIVRITDDEYHRQWWPNGFEEKLYSSGYTIVRHNFGSDMFPVGRASEKYKYCSYSMPCTLLLGSMAEERDNERRIMIQMDGGANLYCPTLEATLANVFEDEITYELLTKREKILRNYLFSKVIKNPSDLYVNKTCNECPNYRVTRNYIYYMDKKVADCDSLSGEEREMDGNILNNILIKEYWGKYSQSQRGKIISRIARNYGISSCIVNKDIMISSNESWTYELPTYGISNQNNSGRCWLYAALNVLRQTVNKKYESDKFFFSANYLAFYDLLEKANYFLDMMIDLAPLDASDRTVTEIIKNPVQDAGQWHYFVDLVKKYGLVPDLEMKSTACSLDTSEMIGLLNRMLRKDAAEIRDHYRKNRFLTKDGREKKDMLYRVFRLLAICLGEPCGTVGEVHIGNKIFQKGMTPQEFAIECIGSMDQFDEYIPLINDPMRCRSFDMCYEIEYRKGMSDGSNVRLLNVRMDEMEKLIMTQLSDGNPVWIGADMSFFVDKEREFCDESVMDINSLILQNMQMEKGDALELQVSQMTHSVVLKGFKTDESGNPVKWIAEDSHGTNADRKGMLTLTEDFMKKYVYEAVILRKYLKPSQISIYEGEAEKLPRWDPIGVLAR